MQMLAGVLGVSCLLSAAVAQQPATPPAAPAAQTPAPASSPKKYEIPADAKPVARQELEGGLIVEDFVVGTGALVGPGSTVTANYHGTLKNGGAPFDSTWDAAFGHTEPATFPLNRVIPGWTKGLPGMKVGGVRRLTIPAAMAYGPGEQRDQNGKVIIPANSDLVFVVELTQTSPVDAPAAAQPQAEKPVQPVAEASVPAADPKKFAIPADAKPVARQELEGGLIVEDFVVGTGAAVLPDSAVVANYHGTLKNGGEPFDSSIDPTFKHVEPATFGLNQVIPGWTKGLPGMKVGGLRRLTIPAAMAYGPQERKDEAGKVTIPANSDLVFVIEMVDTIGSEDVKVGTGAEVSRAAVCVVAITSKTADGKEVEKCGPSDPYILLPGENSALDIAMRGMKVGGKRSISIPGKLNRNAPLPDVKRPSGVPLSVEVELLAVRNLPQQQPGR